MDSAEMESVLTEIAESCGAIAVESGDKPYITFPSAYTAPPGWAGLGKWSQRFYPISEDRAEIEEQFSDWLQSFRKNSAYEIAKKYSVSKQAILERADRLRRANGQFGQLIGGGVWIFTPDEVERLRPGPSGRPSLKMQNKMS